VKLAPPRLLPIVIAAAAALLLFKGIGLVTQGGYSLVGVTPAVAASGGGGAPKAEAGGDHTPAGGGDGSGGVDMTDQSPTLEDGAVTMEFSSGDAKGEAGGGHGGTAGEGEAAAEGDHSPPTPEVGPADIELPEACPPTDAAAAPAEGGEAAAAPHGEAAPAEAAAGGHGGEAAAGDAAHTDPCAPSAGVNEYGDALPMVMDTANGKMVPLADTTDVSSEAAINDRLSERRAELEQREKELDMRSTLMDAAEKRIEERSAELKALEEKIGKLVDDNKTAEQQQFVSLVAMYENMKPKDAAAIFDQLDLPVLIGLANAMNPRKMSPILARMDPKKAKTLTDGIAAADTPADPMATADASSADLTNLPQIVGQ